MNKLNNLKDCKFGCKNEDEVLPILDNYFDTKLIKNDKFNPIDFENDKYRIELKSRRCKKTTYNTIMFNISKLKHFTNDKENYIFFKFTDGLYYYKWTNESMKECYQSFIGRRDRGKDERINAVLIPNRLLSQLII